MFLKSYGEHLVVPSPKIRQYAYLGSVQKIGDSEIQFFRAVTSSGWDVVMFDVGSWCFAGFGMINHKGL